MYVNYDLGSTLELAYKDSESTQPSSQVSNKDIQIGSDAETMGKHHTDIKDPCW
jgi:hypothetical protein